MKIKDASQYPFNPTLDAGGVKRQLLVYMGALWREGVPMNTIDVQQVLTIAKMANAYYPPLILDVEYLTHRPESVVWDFSREATRKEGVELAKELILVFKQEYKGSVGYYDMHANWMDWAQFKFQKKSTAEIQAKYDYFYKWEQELNPVMSVVDVCYPSVYGYFHEYFPGYSGPKGYSANFTYTQYKTIWLNAITKQYNTIKSLHYKPVEWFFTNNYYGIPYPKGNLDWALYKFQTKFGDPVNMWSSPDYVPSGWSEAEVKTMIKYNS